LSPDYSFYCGPTALDSFGNGPHVNAIAVQIEHIISYLGCYDVSTAHVIA
jgi:hypothetical protein